MNRREAERVLRKVKKHFGGGDGYLFARPGKLRRWCVCFQSPASGQMYLLGDAVKQRR